MKEQKYILKNCKSFEPKHIFECGQCFRWNKEENGSYTGIFGNNVLNVKKEENDINIKEICEEYFDLNTSYEEIKEKLSSIDKYLANSIEYGEGIRILNQDLWETIISFEISANNNIPRIKGIIERISKKYGKEIKWNNKSYHTFPSIEELSKASIEELRALGLGFRDKRIYETTQIFFNGEMTLEELKNEEDTEKLRDKLLTLPGVGPKVADCILLFSLKRYEVWGTM